MKTPLAPLKLLWISYNLVALCQFFSAVGELKGKFGLGKKKSLRNTFVTHIVSIKKTRLKNIAREWKHPSNCKQLIIR